MNTWIISIFLCLFIIPNAFAAETKAIQLEGKKLGKFPIKVLGSGKYQNAMIGGKDEDVIESRHMHGFGAEALAGLVLGNLIIGGGGDYMYYVQASKAKDDSDLAGSSTSFFGAAGLAFGRLLILGKYIFQSTYSVNKKDDNGDKLKFTGAEGSYAASLVWRFGKRSFFSAEYNSTTFGKIEGSDSATYKDQKVKFSSVGLAYGMMF